MTQERSIRASALSNYNDCPRRTAAKLFPDEVEAAGYYIIHPKQNIGAAIGHGVHAALEYSLRNKMKDGSSGFNDEAEDAAISALHDDLQGGVNYDKKTAGNIRQAESQVIRSTRLVRTHLVPEVEPVDVEVEFTAEYRGFTITGHADIQESDAMGDLKTGKFTRQNAPQYGVYAMLAETEGFTVSSFRELYVPTVPLDKPAPKPIIEEYDVDRAKEMAKTRLDYIINAYLGFEENNDPTNFPANPDSLLCNPKYCAAYGTKFCREHKGAN